MKPSSLYSNNYTILTSIEKNIKEEWINRRNNEDILNLKTIEMLPWKLRHNLSLFPNNFIDLGEIKENYDISELNAQYLELIEKEDCREREILNFINHTPAYHVVGSILCDNYPFGHHDLYLFKEMWLGNQYRTDYVMIGKGSGGYEFVLIEFEEPDGRITLKNGHFGQAFRNGAYQVEDWNTWMDSHFSTFIQDLNLVKGEGELPKEFRNYDSSRFHYVVVAGRRSDFTDITYVSRRKKLRENNILMLHHDNLYDSSKKLEERNSF